MKQYTEPRSKNHSCSSLFSLTITGSIKDQSINKNDTSSKKELPLHHNYADYGQVFVIFRIKKRLAALDNKVAIIFQKGNVDCDNKLNLFEKIPGSGKWIAVTMIPTNQLLEFKCAVVNDIVEYENGGRTRQILLAESHLCISLSWGKTDTIHFQRRLPKNLGNDFIPFSPASYFFK